MGLKQTAVNVGGIISASTLPLVALALGWRYGFLFLGIVAIAIGIVAFILYKEPPMMTSSPSESSGGIDKPVSLLEVLKNRDIWLVATCGLCLSWVEMAIAGHLVLYLKDRLFFTAIAAGGILAIAEAAGAISRPGSGLLSDRVFGGRRKPVFMMMAATAAVICLLVGLLGSNLSLAIYPVIFLLGLGGIGFGGIFITLLAEFGGRSGTGKAVGLGNTVSMAGSVLGPIVFGYIVDISGSYKLAWLSLSFVAILCLLLLLPLSEERRKI